VRYGDVTVIVTELVISAVCRLSSKGGIHQVAGQDRNGWRVPTLLWRMDDGQDCETGVDVAGKDPAGLLVTRPQARR